MADLLNYLQVFLYTHCDIESPDPETAMECMLGMHTRSHILSLGKAIQLPTLKLTPKLATGMMVCKCLPHAVLSTS